MTKITMGRTYIVLYIIIAVAVVAFLIVVCVIYKEELWSKIKNIFKKKPKSEPKSVKEEKKSPELNNDDFIPLKNQYDDERDASLEELFADDQNYTLEGTEINDDGKKIFGGEIYSEPQVENNDNKPNFLQENDFDFDRIFQNKQNQSNKDKPIADQIKELSPELKAMLVDSLLKKRDDV